MSTRKQPNNHLEATDLDLEKITQRIKELHIQKIVSSSNGGNSKFIAVQNLKQVFNEVISEEESKVAGNAEEIFSSDNLAENIGYNLRDTPSRLNSNRLISANKAPKNECARQMESEVSTELDIEQSGLEKSDNCSIGKYDLRKTPSRNIHADCTQKRSVYKTDTVQQSKENNFKNLWDPKNASTKAEVGDNLRIVLERINLDGKNIENFDEENTEIIRGSYDLRNTPSRMSRIGIEDHQEKSFESSENQKLAGEPSNLKITPPKINPMGIKKQPFESVTRENQEITRDDYDLRLTPSRMNRLVVEEPHSESVPKENRDNVRDDYDLRLTPSRINRLVVEEQPSESVTKEDQEIVRNDYDLRLTPARINRAENDNLTDDEDSTERIVEGIIAEESQFMAKEALKKPNDWKATPHRADDAEENPIPQPELVLKSQTDSECYESCSSKTTAKDCDEKNQSDNFRKSEFKVGKTFFRCTNFNPNDTQNTKRQSLHQRFGANSKEASSDRSSPKTYRLFNANPSPLKNVPLKPMSSPYSSQNLRMVTLSKQATAKYPSPNVLKTMASRVTPKKVRSSLNGSPVNDQVAKKSPKPKINGKKFTNIGRTPFMEKSQILSGSQSLNEEDDKLKKPFRVEKLKENNVIQNF